MLHSTRYHPAANTLPRALQWNPGKDIPRKTWGWTSAGSSAAAELGRGADLSGDVPEAIEDRTEHIPGVLYKALLLILEKTKQGQWKPPGESSAPSSHLGWAISQERLKPWRESRRDETNTGQGVTAAFKKKKKIYIWATREALQGEIESDAVKQKLKREVQMSWGRRKKN